MLPHQPNPEMCDATKMKKVIPMTPKEYQKKILQAKRFEQTRLKGVKNWKAKISLNGEVRIKPVSEKRMKENRIYQKVRKQFLEAYPECQARISPNCRHEATDIHHRQKRRTEEQRLNPVHWMAVCRPCHLYIESHDQQSRELGFIENGLK